METIDVCPPPAEPISSTSDRTGQIWLYAVGPPAGRGAYYLVLSSKVMRYGAICHDVVKTTPEARTFVTYIIESKKWEGDDYWKRVA